MYGICLILFLQGFILWKWPLICIFTDKIVHETVYIFTLFCLGKISSSMYSLWSVVAHLLCAVYVRFSLPCIRGEVLLHIYSVL